MLALAEPVWLQTPRVTFLGTEVALSLHGMLHGWVLKSNFNSILFSQEGGFGYIESKDVSNLDCLKLESTMIFTNVSQY